MTDATHAPRRTWQCTLFGPAAQTAIALLESAGYVHREGPGPGQYSDWFDMDPRHGSTSSALYVVEDAARPIVDQLQQQFGGSIDSSR